VPLLVPSFFFMRVSINDRRLNVTRVSRMEETALPRSCGGLVTESIAHFDSTNNQIAIS